MYLKLPVAMDVLSSYKVSQVMRSATPSRHMVIAPVVKNLIRRMRRKSPTRAGRKYLQSRWTKAFSSTLVLGTLTQMVGRKSPTRTGRKCLQSRWTKAGSGSCEKDSPLCIVSMKKEEQAC